MLGFVVLDIQGSIDFQVTRLQRDISKEKQKEVLVTPAQGNMICSVVTQPRKQISVDTQIWSHNAVAVNPSSFIWFLS